MGEKRVSGHVNMFVCNGKSGFDFGFLTLKIIALIDSFGVWLGSVSMHSFRGFVFPSGDLISLIVLIC